MRKALVVGIDNYPNCPLYGCCNDAKAIENMLCTHGDGTPNFAVKRYENTDTKGRLRTLIEHCFDGDADLALFYYSGHGFIDAVGGYLVTPDATNGDYGVSLYDVLSIANNSKCKERIVILDSCYSGHLGKINTSSQNTTVINEGVTFMTSCRNSETSKEVDGHGVFTSLLIEALSGGAADISGHITPGNIYAFIDKALGPWDQRPVFKTNVTRFTSLRDVTPQVDLSIIRKLCTYFPDANGVHHLDPSYEPTNNPAVDHSVIKPYADPRNTAIFSDLQKLEGVGIIVPVDEEHMYYAAMNSRACKLTAVGKQYWRLVQEGKI